jgi:hypothetical protein
MDDEKIYAALDRKVDRAGGRIDGRADSRDGAGVLDLQTVQRIRPIIDFADAEMLVGVGDDLRESRHARHFE